MVGCDSPPIKPGLSMSKLTLCFVSIGLFACRNDKDESTTDSASSETGETAIAPVDADGDGFNTEEDCDDTDANVHPDAVEACNDVDDNCDGLVDDDDPELDSTTQTTWYLDDDGDGYGAEADAIDSCLAPIGYVVETASGFDCDDTDPAYHPGAAELDCTDPNDYNCDGSVGYADQDGDGFAACDDCDDSLPAVNSSATEICDGIDNDCDGWTDDMDPDVTGTQTWYGDADGDTYGGQQFVAESCEAPQGYVDNADDCDDLDAATYPGAAEICDEADNNCDGDIDEGVQITWYADTDNDGYGDSTATKEACTVPAGYVWDATDCDDTSATTNPASYEVCDGADNNCDGVTDEDSALDVETWYADNDGDGYGDATTTDIACDQPSGYVTDDNDCDDTSATTYPGADEYCDSVDTDCDGTVDESSALDADTWYADGDSDGYGDSTSTDIACDQPTGYVADNTDCDDTLSATNPTATEVCDGVDNNCSGTIDDDSVVLGDTSTCTALSCSDLLSRRSSATSGSWWVDPDGNGTFEVDCDMSTSGGGWIELSLDDSQQMLMAEYDSTNPWRKCSDDSGKHYSWIGESSVSPDNAGSSVPADYTHTLAYIQPSTSSSYSPSQLTALRSVVTQLYSSTRMVAVTADDDNASYEDGDGSGHEVWVMAKGGSWVVATPGTNGDCGGGTGWGSQAQAAHYLWSTDASSSDVDGETNISASSMGALDPTLVIPYQVKLGVYTGGGVSFGWEEKVFLVK